MLCNLARDLVAFQHVLKSSDLETELVCNAYEHQNFIRAIAVRVDVASPFQNFNERFKLQIPARLNQITFAALLRRTKFIPRAFVIACACERLAYSFLYAHARRGVASPLSRNLRKVRALWILAERELNAGQSAGERKLFNRTTVLQFHNERLSTDGVARSMQHIDGRYAACQFAVDVDVRWIKHVSHVHHRSDRERQFVHSINHSVRVAINYAGRDVLSRSINDASVGGRAQVLTDVCYLTVMNQNVRVLNRAVRSRQHSRIANQSIAAACGLRLLLLPTTLSTLLSTPRTKRNRNGRKR